MNANTAKLQQLGQSLWIDNITRQMLDDNTLAGYIHQFSIIRRADRDARPLGSIRRRPLHPAGIA